MWLPPRHPESHFLLPPWEDSSSIAHFPPVLSFPLSQIDRPENENAFFFLASIYKILLVSQFFQLLLYSLLAFTEICFERNFYYSLYNLTSCSLLYFLPVCFCFPHTYSLLCLLQVCFYFSPTIKHVLYLSQVVSTWLLTLSKMITDNLQKCLL